MNKSETSKCRKNLIKFCGHIGLDLGYGGDPIKPEAITLDSPEPYASVGTHEQNLRGDARDLYWFKDNVLDYVFSSHLLEDFEESKIPKILKEWLRVIKPEGFLVLYLPDQEKYLQYCKDHNWDVNPGHKVNMSLSFMNKIFLGIENIEIVRTQNDPLSHYSFEMVIKKL